MNKLIVLIVVVLFFNSCGKETQSTTQGGGTFYVRMTISPPLSVGSRNVNGSKFYNSVSLWGPNFNSGWSGSNSSTPLSVLNSTEISVTKGQNITAYWSLSNYKDCKCVTLTFEGIQNGNVIKTYTLNGGLSDTTFLNNCATGNTVTYPNFIIQ
jgi:hypothetical protein